MSIDELPEIFSNYDIVATSSIFSAQTRMQFEVAAVAAKVSGERLVAACREFWQEINDKKYIKMTEERLLEVPI